MEIKIDSIKRREKGARLYGWLVIYRNALAYFPVFCSFYRNLFSEINLTRVGVQTLVAIMITRQRSSDKMRKKE